MFRTVNGENALHKYIWNGTDNGIEWDLDFIYITNNNNNSNPNHLLILSLVGKYGHI